VHVARAIASLVGTAALAACGGAEVETAQQEQMPADFAGCVPDEVAPGANVFARAGCLGCHTYDGEGQQNLDAPDLTAIGTTERGADGFAQLLRNPPPPHPSFESLGEEQLAALGAFLHASRGC
jgi:cytochrome c553